MTRRYPTLEWKQPGMIQQRRGSAAPIVRLSIGALLVLLLAACGPGPLVIRRGPPAVSDGSEPSATAAPAPTATARPTATPTPAPTPIPTTTPIPQPWRFVVLGDTRTEGLKPPDVTNRIVEQARAAQPEVALAVGDMINALDDQASVREQWRLWREVVAPLGARHLLVTPGNHDVQGNAWATDLLVEAFPELPTNGPAGFERRAYAFDYRGVRF